jgi:hypothetical protein
MTPHLFGHRSRHGDEKLEDIKGGWGPLMTVPFAKPDGTQLFFSWRLPTVLELVDIPTLAEQATGAPPEVSEGAAAIVQAQEAGLMILAGALRAVAEPIEKRDVLATMTVVLADLHGKPDPQDFVPPDGPRTLHSKVDIEKINDRAWVIERNSAESPGEGEPPMPLFMIEYLVHMDYGMLAVTFTATGHGMGSPWARGVYRNVARGSRLGPEPPTDA